MQYKPQSLPSLGHRRCHQISIILKVPNIFYLVSVPYSENTEIQQVRLYLSNVIDIKSLQLKECIKIFNQELLRFSDELVQYIFRRR